MEGRYRTLKSTVRVETAKVKGSRFIATALEFQDEDRLAEEIRSLREEFPDANHHCWAWRDGDRFRYGDDGEPSGSAGKPILQQIDGHDLDRVAVIVTRIFGGTKLGVGGLVRAYGGGAREVLDAAEIVEVIPYREVTVSVPYELGGAVARVANRFDLDPRDPVFDERIRQGFHVPLAELDRFVGEIVETTAGRAGIEVRDPDASRS